MIIHNNLKINNHHHSTAPHKMKQHYGSGKMCASPRSETSYEFRKNHNYYGSSNVPSLSSMTARESSNARADDWSSIIDSPIYVESPNRDLSEETSSMQIMVSQPMATPAYVHHQTLHQCKNWQYGCKFELVYDGKSKITHKSAKYARADDWSLSHINHHQSIFTHKMKPHYGRGKMCASPRSETLREFRANHNYYASSNASIEAQSLSSMITKDSSSGKSTAYPCDVELDLQRFEEPNRDLSDTSSIRIIDSQRSEVNMATPAFTRHQTIYQCQFWHLECKKEYVLDELQCPKKPLNVWSQLFFLILGLSGANLSVHIICPYQIDIDVQIRVDIIWHFRMFYEILIPIEAIHQSCPQCGTIEL